MKKELISKTIIRALIGAIIGIAISIAICLISGSYRDIINHPGAFVAQVTGSALLGLVNMGAMSIYDIESWGLVKTTVIHFIISFTSFLLANTLLGWFERNVLVIVIIAFVSVYFLIWLIQYLVWKKEIKNLNNDLKNMISKEEEGDRHE
ncbi:MAG: DUF3021 domain-containing protein [Lachnospiraceae bacterium]|nr:DUF3021 domain-containing protein [Lachnospiraceae bacterium]